MMKRIAGSVFLITAACVVACGSAPEGTDAEPRRIEGTEAQELQRAVDEGNISAQSVCCRMEGDAVVCYVGKCPPRPPIPLPIPVPTN